MERVPHKERIHFESRRSNIPPLRVIGQKFAPHQDFYHWILRRSWPEFILLVAIAYFATNILFALLYVLEPNDLANARSQNLEDAFYFSIQTFGTIGYGYMAPVSRWANILVVAESFVGLMLTALVTGISFARFARPSSRVLFSEKAVISTRDGQPHLMFRLANWRTNTVVEAQLKVILLVVQRTMEGEMMRVPVELPLVRDRTNLFILSWTAMHRIDEKSPFYGPDAIDRLRKEGAELYLSFTGLDETLGQTVHARYAYRLDDIVPNARFADVLAAGPDGTRIMDYRHFHKIIPQNVQTPQ